MLQDAHSRKISIAVSAAPGDTTVIAALTDGWIYVHELIGDLDVNGTLSVLTGSTIRSTFDLDAGQGITVQDEAGEDNRPRYECKPGEAFVLRLSVGSTFKGTLHYSIRY